ncbi:STM4015 family protein [Actinomadura macrotermitis]|uniref:Leucine-rich repeat domain-containing protein n=1 Tax=Actinomadura macrotermitis TaxID=2585200 RepID=A0A7K0C4K8_9ACTN|nr:STM4015 family protein [Actinomadura macrotermitis]MQY08296.1 hypothetical protein [Actinomadura macrotermitis]
MSVGHHLTEFADLPVFDFDTETDTESLPDAAAVAWRVRSHYVDPSWEDVFEDFLDCVDTERVTALILGFWSGTCPAGLLVEAADRFPALRAVFAGDITGEEFEISWINQGDLTPLVAAFPRLEVLEARGGSGLEFEPVAGSVLRRLRFETGGLPGEVVRAVAASDLPNLEHLDLWLGDEDYGCTTELADFAPFLAGDRFPALRHLGLENSEFQDEIATAVAGAPVVARLESLSLAMGVLSDRGAEALLSGQPLTHLRRLDLHHHFLTDTMAERLRAALPATEVDLSDPQYGGEERGFYVMVTE